MIKNCRKYLTFGWVLLLLYACSDTEAPDKPFGFEKPEHFPEPTYTFENNPVTKAGFELGKKLFFDPMLSRDNSVSCNNCHQQSRAFADTPLHATSIGIDNQFGIRNAPSMANMAFMQEFFWDGGVTHLDFVPINAIESDIEMGESLASVVEKLNNDEEYLALFQAAFGVSEITSPFMLHALSQFTVMMVSANSTYDKYVLEGQPLTELEMAGMNLFQQKCSACHQGELFTDFSHRNNGISSVFGDEGRATITEDPSDIGKFRVPSLRNVEITAPYMHNARFNTLEEVLDHYDGNMVDSPSLDPMFKNGGEVVGIPMTEEEKVQIIAFLKTLTDHDFISNPLFRNND
ncbi:cytochrome-c peroxidase [Roseivirga pacifica]|uniref:cytochrome-c peroxidase n=1 Tax=Roseivirga pacifica TaxID=1267423 RepID=UPI00227D59D7|nr:cytochrome c peroxidase [Roseivirga pacifica]